MSDVNDWNQQVIEEFRANGGLVGGPFEGQPVILVHHRGRRSGAERVNPLVYQKVDSGWAVFVSFADYEVKAGDRTIPVVVLEPVS